MQQWVFPRAVGDGKRCKYYTAYILDIIILFCEHSNLHSVLNIYSISYVTLRRSLPQIFCVEGTKANATNHWNKQFSPKTSDNQGGLPQSTPPHSVIDPGIHTSLPDVRLDIQPCHAIRGTVSPLPRQPGLAIKSAFAGAKVHWCPGPRTNDVAASHSGRWSASELHMRTRRCERGAAKLERRPGPPTDVDQRWRVTDSRPLPPSGAT